jgi:hypothetical protein
MEQLTFADPAPSSELDELVWEIDRRLDACFLGELEVALDRLRGAVEPEPERA